jgi:hypothetical protein
MCRATIKQICDKLIKNVIRADNRARLLQSQALLEHDQNMIYFSLYRSIDNG